MIASDFYYGVVLPQYFVLDSGLVAVNTKCGIVFCGPAPEIRTQMISSNVVCLSRVSTSVDQKSPANYPYEEWETEFVSTDACDEDLVGLFYTS